MTIIQLIERQKDFHGTENRNRRF